MAECVAPSQEIYYAPDDLSGKHIEICVSSQGLAKLQRSFEDFLLALITSYGPVDGVFECVFSQTADWSMHSVMKQNCSTIPQHYQKLLPRPGLTGRPPTCVQSQLVGDLVEEVYDILRSAGELLAELSRSPYYIADAVMWPLRGFVEDDDTTTTATTAAAITRHKRLYRGRTIRSLNPSEGRKDDFITRGGTEEAFRSLHSTLKLTESMEPHQRLIIKHTETSPKVAVMTEIDNMSRLTPSPLLTIFSLAVTKI
ncbi:hypothetical protein CHU98_g9003 [Xylaria longipes]|nr:hypothetical protein CHU98_g9003 [Xylaria longipes]